MLCWQWLGLQLWNIGQQLVFSQWKQFTIQSYNVAFKLSLAVRLGLVSKTHPNLGRVTWLLGRIAWPCCNKANCHASSFRTNTFKIRARSFASRTLENSQRSSCSLIARIYYLVTISIEPGIPFVYFSVMTPKWITGSMRLTSLITVSMIYNEC